MLGAIALITSCSQDRVPTSPSSPNFLYATDTGGAPADTTRPPTTMQETAACTEYDAGHCNFLHIELTEIQWMNNAVADAGVKCPDLQNFLNIAQRNGLIHKIDIVAATGLQNVNAEWHNQFPANSDYLKMRIHLDQVKAFQSAEVLRAELYHEGMHALHPTDTDDVHIEQMAQACIP
jgi:hypothetical protein